MLDKKQIADIRAVLDRIEDGFPLALDALGDPCRFKIFMLVMDYHELCVTDIARIFDISVPAASQQLKVLERLSLIKRMRMGQMVCYEVNLHNPIAKQTMKVIKELTA